MNTPAGCAAYATRVSRISTDGLPEIAVGPMNVVIGTMRDVATACQAGDQAGVQRAVGRFWVAIGQFSKVPGINPKG